MDAYEKAGDVDGASRYLQGLRPFHDRNLGIAQAAHDQGNPVAVAKAVERLNNFHANRTDLKVVPNEGGYQFTLTPERGGEAQTWQVSPELMDKFLKSNATQFDSLATNGPAKSLDILTRAVPPGVVDPTDETLTGATEAAKLEAVDPTDETLTPGNQAEPPLATGADLAGAAPIARQGELFSGDSGASLANMPIPSSIGPYGSSGQPKAPEAPQATKPPPDPNKPAYSRANPHPSWKGLNVQDTWNERGRYNQSGAPQVDIKSLHGGAGGIYTPRSTAGPYVPAAGDLGALRIPPGGSAPKGWDMYHSEDVHNPGDSGWIAVPPGVAPGMKDVTKYTIGGGKVTLRVPEFWDENKMRYSGEGYSSGERLYPNPTGTRLDAKGQPVRPAQPIAEQAATITRGGPDFREFPSSQCRKHRSREGCPSTMDRDPATGARCRCSGSPGWPGAQCTVHRRIPGRSEAGGSRRTGSRTDGPQASGSGTRCSCSSRCRAADDTARLLTAAATAAWRLEADLWPGLGRNAAA